MHENLRGLRKVFRESTILGFGYSSRKGAKHALSKVEWDAKFGKYFFLPLRLCAFAGDTPSPIFAYFAFFAEKFFFPSVAALLR